MLLTLRVAAVCVPACCSGAGHVWVANHTTMVDYIVLSSYHAFAVIMQLHPGWVGFLQTQVLDSLNCLWFNRTQVCAGQITLQWYA
jgi:glycerol-3-phosphate O-acyltransferase 3/4